MKSLDRRKFIKETALTAGAVVAAPNYIKDFVKNSPNDKVNVAWG